MSDTSQPGTQPLSEGLPETNTQAGDAVDTVDASDEGHGAGPGRIIDAILRGSSEEGVSYRAERNQSLIDYIEQETGALL